MASNKEQAQVARSAGVADGAVVQLLLSECSNDGLVRLLGSEVGDMRDAAIICLGLKGTTAHCAALVKLLPSEESGVAELVENSLWQIWMRAGSGPGNAMLARAIDMIRRELFDDALGLLEGLCADEPEFAEAHNQRGIVLCFLNRPDEAASAFRRALRLNRYHFSAAVSLGHTFVERRDLRAALRHYRYALRLNPRLEDIPDVVKRLEAALGNGRSKH